MKSKIIFHFFIFLFGFFIGNLFPTFFGHIVGSITSFFLLLILEGFNFIGTRPRTSRERSAGFAERSYALQRLRSPYEEVNPTRNFSGLWNAVMSMANSSAQAANKASNKRRNRSSDCAPLSEAAAKHSPVILVSIFNSLKIGILFGLFVDAFKVGS